MVLDDYVTIAILQVLSNATFGGKIMIRTNTSTYDINVNGNATFNDVMDRRTV